jgi:hypothetical protein
MPELPELEAISHYLNEKIGQLCIRIGKVISGIKANRGIKNFYRTWFVYLCQTNLVMFPLKKQELYLRYKN